MHVIDIVFAVGWVVFWLFWFMAAVGAKAGRANWGKFALTRVAIVVVVILLAHSRAFKGHSVVTSPLLEGIGLAVFCLGLAIAVWARLNIGRNWGMPMSQKVDPDLVTTGPYRYVRHPIYSGILLAAIGTAIGVSIYWLVAVALLGAYFIYSATQEEQYMTSRFPDTYPEYKQSTKMLIPFLL
jgi:protein-S-isoprenylcysteine O-methyltransferase Ste14